MNIRSQPSDSAIRVCSRSHPPAHQVAPDAPRARSWRFFKDVREFADAYCTIATVEKDAEGGLNLAKATFADAKGHPQAVRRCGARCREATRGAATCPEGAKQPTKDRNANAFVNCIMRNLDVADELETARGPESPPCSLSFRGHAGEYNRTCPSTILGVDFDAAVLFGCRDDTVASPVSTTSPRR